MKSLPPLEVADGPSTELAVETCVKHLISTQGALANYDFDTASGVLQLLQGGEEVFPHDLQVAAEVLLQVESGEVDAAKKVGAVLEAEVKRRTARLGQPFRMTVTPAAQALGVVPVTPAPERKDRMLDLFRRWLEEFDA